MGSDDEEDGDDDSFRTKYYEEKLTDQGVLEIYIRQLGVNQNQVGQYISHTFEAAVVPKDYPEPDSDFYRHKMAHQFTVRLAALAECYSDMCPYCLLPISTGGVEVTTKHGFGMEGVPTPLLGPKKIVIRAHKCCHDWEHHTYTSVKDEKLIGGPWDQEFWERSDAITVAFRHRQTHLDDGGKFGISMRDVRGSGAQNAFSSGELFLDRLAGKPLVGAQGPETCKYGPPTPGCTFSEQLDDEAETLTKGCGGTGLCHKHFLKYHMSPKKDKRGRQLYDNNGCMVYETTYGPERLHTRPRCRCTHL